jgi:predicted dehydrogenase
MNRIRIGIVGVGMMGQAAHLRNYLCTPDCEVAAIAEVRPRLGALVASRYGIPALYADHRAMISAERLDGIVAVQQYTRHALLVPELLAAGVPIMIEKPLARSSALADHLAAQARAAGIPVYVGYHKRSDPASASARWQLREWRASGAVGRLRYVRITVPDGEWTAGGFSHHLATDEPAPNQPLDPPAADLDPAAAKLHEHLVNGTVHQLDYLRFLLGERYTVASLDATGVLLTATSASGVPAVIELSPYRCSGDWQERAQVCFERGYVQIELPAPLALNRAGRVTVFTDSDGGAATATPILPQVHAMRAQAEAFVRACRGEATDLCCAEEAAEDIHAVDRCTALLIAARTAPAPAAAAAKG